MNYSEIYNEYWNREDRIGADSGDLSQFADMVLRICGLGRLLDVGCGEGRLVQELLKRGIDSKGLDVSVVVLDRARRRIPGRLFEGSILDLPFEDDSFDTIVSTDCLEHIREADVPKALRELWRVTARYVVLQIAITVDKDGRWHETVMDRSWWERACFEAGFRKHPAYYEAIDYESLQSDGWQIVIPLEKIPSDVVERYPLEVLVPERGLHMDMLRDGGDRSDAHVIRYTLASKFVRPGDRVLDAACGMGYGSHVVEALTDAEFILGIDNSPFAIDYSSRNYGSEKTLFKTGDLPDVLKDFPNDSFDMVISFETLEHVPEPQAVIAEFRRVLKPGGRIFVSVPNDWSDESGEDPNPFHLHVYDWNTIHDQIASDFIVERAFQQIATQCKVAEKGGGWALRPRTLREISLPDEHRPDSEWWLLLGMKEPVAKETQMNEADARRFGTVSQGLSNPWLYTSMIHYAHRLQNIYERDLLCDTVMQTADASTNDHHAALCVKAYILLGKSDSEASEVHALCRHIAEKILTISGDSGLDLRWKVSLQFVQAKLLQKIGNLAEARDLFERVGEAEFLNFSVHIATKVTEAIFQAGFLSLSLGDKSRAQAIWRLAIDVADKLLTVRATDILVNLERPNLFDRGDGVREYALAWDFIARVANGLHLLDKYSKIDKIPTESLLNSFSYKVEVLNRDLRSARESSANVTRELGAKSVAVESLDRALHDRTNELISVRETLVDRTARLEDALKQPTRTEQLDGLVKELEIKNASIERLCRDLDDRTNDLITIRETLVDRTARLEDALARLSSKDDKRSIFKWKR